MKSKGCWDGLIYDDMSRSGAAGVVLAVAVGTIQEEKSVARD